jgi:hypothetical protein
MRAPRDNLLCMAGIKFANAGVVKVMAYFGTEIFGDFFKFLCVDVIRDELKSLLLIPF